MPKEQEKNCGNCGWSQPIEDRPDAVDCTWIFHNQIPISVVYNQSYMRVSEGVCCPCWTPKPEEGQG